MAICCGVTAAMAQTYDVPVSEKHEKMQTGKFQPTWQSLETHQTPEWFRNAMVSLKLRKQPGDW